MKRIGILLLAGLALAIAALPASAQMGGKHHRGDDQKAAPKKQSVDDKAYKAALESIPEPKGPVDPWGQMRPVDPRKK